MTRLFAAERFDSLSKGRPLLQPAGMWLSSGVRLMQSRAQRVPRICAH